MIKYGVIRLTNGHPEFCGEFNTENEAEAKVESLRIGCPDVFVVLPRFIPEPGASDRLMSDSPKTVRT